MSGFSNSVENSLLALIFNATNWSLYADNTATTPLTNLYMALHNADPGEGGNQTTNETAYTNYVRQAIARTSGGFTVSGTDPTQVVNAGIITFPLAGAVGDTLTHWSLGTLSSGAGVILVSGPLGPVAGPYLDFTCTSASPGSMTVPGSAFAVNDRVSVYHDPTSTLPTGFTEGTVYYVGTASGATITLSTTTANGNPVNTSSVGAGYVVKQTPLVVSALVTTPSFAASTIKFMIN